MTAALTLYFDGRCPFCVASMGRLRGWNTAGQLALVDITAAGFDPASLGTSMAALYRWFARHRYTFSRWLGYRLPAACDGAGAGCAIGSPFMK